MHSIRDQRATPLPRSGFSEDELDAYLTLELDRFRADSNKFWRQFEKFARAHGENFLRTQVKKHCFSLLSDTLGLGDWYALGAPLEFVSKLVTGFRIEFLKDPAQDGPIIVESPKTPSQWEELRSWVHDNVADGRLIQVPETFAKFVHDVFLLKSAGKTSCIVNPRA